jgi:hypothetical protein
MGKDPCFGRGHEEIYESNLFYKIGSIKEDCSFFINMPNVLFTCKDESKGSRGRYMSTLNS